MENAETSTDKCFKDHFGKWVKENLFDLNPNLTFVHHGAYGAAPKQILEKKRQYQLEMVQCPDKWFRYTSFDIWKRNAKSLADYLNVNDENLLLANNATEAVNAIFKSIEFDGCRDVILTTSISFKSLLKTLDYTSKYRLNEENRVNIYQVEIKMPFESSQSIVDLFDRACSMLVNEKKLRIRAVLIDHITSSTAIMFPIKQINQVIRKWSKNDCKIIVDGAHAIGQIKLKLEDYGCDFYVSNLHKWFLAPISCALLYTRDVSNFDPEKFQPNYISFGYGVKNVKYNFFERATLDQTSLYVIEDCIHFYEKCLGGYETILNHATSILTPAVEMLVKEWGTHTLPMAEELEAPLMKVIKLPPLPDYKVDADIEINKVLMRDLIEKFNLVAGIFVIENELYCRISCFVYNCMDDYVKLKDAILQLSTKSTNHI